MTSRANYDSLDGGMATADLGAKHLPSTDMDGTRRYVFGRYEKTYFTSTSVAGAGLADLENIINLADEYSALGVAAFFGFLRLICTPFINLFLGMVNFFLWLVQRAFLEVLPLLYDQLFKPYIWIGYTYFVLPIFTYTWNVLNLILTLDTLHSILNAIVNAICRMLSSIKIVEINYGPRGSRGDSESGDYGSNYGSVPPSYGDGPASRAGSTNSSNNNKGAEIAVDVI